MWLYRPCGLEEMALVWRSGSRRWPPRLPEQPIFYPVTNQGYAAQISRDWNTKSGSLLGYVTRFEVDDAYVSRFERQIVGAREHEELWVPAEALEEFNDHIVGLIEVVELFAHSLASGCVPESGTLAGKDALEQLAWFRAHIADADIEQELCAASEHVWLNWPLWKHAAREDRHAQEVLAALASSWGKAGMLALPDVIANRTT